MSTLAGRHIDQSYKDLITIDNAGAGADSTLRFVQDGKGDNLPLKLSTTSIQLQSDLDLNNNKITGVGANTTLVDANGNPILGFSPQASSDCYLAIDNEGQTTEESYPGPHIRVVSGRGDTDIQIEPKGAGVLWLKNPALYGTISAEHNQITKVANPANVKDAANKDYVDTNFQPKDADLTAIGAISETSGLLKKTAANTWSLDTSTYQTTSTRLTNLIAQSGTSGFLTKTGADTWSLDTATYLQPTPISNSGSLSMTGSVYANGIESANGNLAVGNTNASSHVWYLINNVNRGICYVNYTTGSMVLHPYDTNGNALTNSMIELRADNTGVNIGQSYHYTDGNIYGSIWGGWLSNKINTKLTGDWSDVVGFSGGTYTRAYLRHSDTTPMNIVVGDSFGSASSLTHTYLYSTHLHVQGYQGAFGVTTWSSAEALKENIQPTQVRGLDKIKQIQMKSFKFRDKTIEIDEAPAETAEVDGEPQVKPAKKKTETITGQQVDIGVVAEDLEKIDPDLVYMTGDNKNINPNKLICYLLKAVQEADAKTEALVKRIEELEKRKE